VLLDIANLIGHIVVSGNVRRCLAYDTPVWTQDSTTATGSPNDPRKLRLKQMKDVVAGDYVWTHLKRWRRVTAAFRQGPQECYVIKTSNGETFRATSKHLLYVENARGDRIWKTTHEVSLRARLRS